MSLSPRIDKIEAPNTPQSDAVATRLGQKQYLHGTTYNGGIAPTVTGSTATISRAVFIPYQMQDGTWRLKFNINLGTSGGVAGGTDYSISVNGITFASSQSVTAQQLSSGTATIIYAYVDGSASTIGVRFNASVTALRYHGDVELASKPTWAY